MRQTQTLHQSPFMSCFWGRVCLWWSRHLGAGLLVMLLRYASDANSPPISLHVVLLGSSVPMVVEALGGWAPGSISTIRRIGDFLGQKVNPLDPSHSTKHLFGRLAITLWHGNAILWLRQAPSLAPSSDRLS